MFEVLGADRYSINIQKVDDKLYNMELIFFYDRDNKDNRDTFQNSIPYFVNATKAMSIIGHSVTEIDKENLILKLILTTTFERISDTIVGEFINHGSLGKVTISQLFTIVSYATVDMVNKMKDSMKE